MKVSFDTDRARAVDDTRHWAALALSAEEKMSVEDALAVDELGEDPLLRTWPYVHAGVRLDPAWPPDAEVAGERLLAKYAALLRVFDIRIKGAELLPPYNLLATRTWMVLVPRRHEVFEGIAVNALGFAGSMLVRSDALLAYLREIGPLAVLREVGVK